MANPRNPLARRFTSFGVRLIRFTFIIAAYVIGGNLSASLTRLNRQMTRNDAQLALHPPTDATTQIPNPLPDGAITAHVSSHAGAPAYSASENVLVSPVSLFHQPFVSYISLLIIILPSPISLPAGGGVASLSWGSIGRWAAGKSERKSGDS